MFLEREEYQDDPVLNGQHDNPAIEYVWGLFRDPALVASGGGGMGPAYLTQQDVSEYQKNMGVEIADKLFIRALLLASRVYGNARAEHERELSENASEPT